jgi:hypothetical protein
MWDQKTLCVRSDLVDDSVVFSQHELKFIVIHLELVFLQKNNLGTLRNVNSNSGKTFSFSDESEDFRVEVDVQLVVIRMSDDQSSLKTSLSFLDFMSPLLSPEIFEREESVTNLIVHLDEFLGLFLSDQMLRELFHGSGNSVEEMSRPGDATRDSRQVTNDRRV